jgi:hypothetical protein
MSEEHLDLLSFSTRDGVGLGLGDRTGPVTSSFMNGSRDLACQHIRTALGFAFHDPFRHAARHHGLEQLAQEIALAEAAVSVLGERRMIGDVAVEPQATEPTIGEIEMDLLAQASSARRSQRRQGEVEVRRRDQAFEKQIVKVIRAAVAQASERTPLFPAWAGP